jgi:hypothetical protein
MLPRKLNESYKKSVINLKIIAKTKEDVMTALTLAITGSILPHIALASITKIIARPIIRLKLLQSSKTK